MGKPYLPNKTTALAQNQKILAGVDKYFAKVKTLTVAGTVFTPKALKAVLEAESEAIQSLDAAKAQLMQQVATADAARLKARGVRQDLRTHILGTFGAKAVQMLQDFGMHVPKPLGRQTAIVRAAAVTKAAATRKAHKATVSPVVEAPPAPAARAASNTPS